jgi:hypothetical protein
MSQIRDITNYTLREDRKREQKFTELDTWIMFYQLLRAATVMDRGSEDMAVERWKERQIIHFDMKPGNSTCQILTAPIL